jgi:hypothetical protein
VVSRGVEGDAFEGIDTAYPYVELFIAKLLDGLGIAVRHLPLLGNFVGTPVQGEVISVQGYVPRSEYQCPGGQQARAECKQLCPRGFPSCLKLRCALRASDRPDIVCGD